MEVIYRRPVLSEVALARIAPSPPPPPCRDTRLVAFKSSLGGDPGKTPPPPSPPLSLNNAIARVDIIREGSRENVAGAAGVFLLDAAWKVAGCRFS